MLVAVLALCVGQAVAASHLHLDEHEEEDCTVCAVAEPGHAPHVGGVGAEPSQWRRADGPPAFATFCPRRPYEFHRPRAPPVRTS